MIAVVRTLIKREFRIRQLPLSSLQRNMLFIILLSLCTVSFGYSQEDIDTKDRAQPKLSLWKVDEAHLENHHEGTSYYVECGGESYLRYQGAGTSENIIMVILNEGNAPLRLKLPLTLEAYDNNSYEIVQQPGKKVLAPNEEAHFIVKYSAPDSYQDDKAKVYISSNDSDHQMCELNLDVGISGPDFSKVFTPDEIGPGSVSSLTFTIVNNTGFAVTDLAFTDALPLAMTIADPAVASTTCLDGMVSAPDGGGTISLSGGKVGIGETCTVTVDVTSSTLGVHTNTSGSLTSSAGTGDTASDDLTVSTSLPGFSKSFAPASVPLGGRSGLTFTVNNSANPSGILNLDFTDVMPTGMEIASPANASTDCGTASVPPTLTAYAGASTVTLDANGTFAFPAVAAGATCTISVDVVATGIGELDNVSGLLVINNDNDTPAGKASSTLEATITPISIEKKFVDDPTPPGGKVMLDFKLTNFDRNFSATAVSFSDDLSSVLPGTPDLSFTSLVSSDCGGSITGVGTTMIGLTGGTIAPGASCTISTSITVPTGATPGIYPNITTAITGTVDGVMETGNMAGDSLFVSPIPILTKEFLDATTLLPDPVVNSGDDVVLRFTVTNTSTTSGATDIAFIDELTDGSSGFPPDITSGFLPFPVTVALPGSACGGSIALVSVGEDRQGLSLTGGTLTAAPGGGATCTFDVTVTIPEGLAPGDYLNTTEEITATVDGATRTGEPASDNLIVIAAPQLSKAFTDDPVVPGNPANMELTLNYTLNNTTDATGITFTDDLNPLITAIPGLTISGLPQNNTCGTGSSLTETGGVITFAGGIMMPGETCTFNITLNVPSSAPSGSFINTTSDVSATVSGLPTTSPSASDDLDIGALVFTKEFTDDPLIAGETGTLRFTLDNGSLTDDATGMHFTDNLAAILPGTPDLMITTALPAAVCGGMLTNVIPTFLTFSGGSVSANSNCFFELDFLVPVGVADGIYSNITSSLTGLLDGSSFTTDPATDNININSNLIGLSKSFTDDPVSPGDNVTLNFTLTNLDDAQALSAVAFTDNLDAALSGMTYDVLISDDCGGTVAGIGTGLVTVSGVSIPASGSCTISISAAVPAGAAPGNHINTTSDLTGTLGGFAVTGDAASDVLEITNLLLFSKSFDGPTTATGTPLLTFTITNPGPTAVTDLFFSDDLDALLSGLEATNLPLSDVCGTGSMLTGTSTISLTGGTLPPSGGMCSFVVELLVPGTATSGTFPNTTSDLFESGLKVANPATADLIIEPAPTFTKVFTPDNSDAGDVSTLTFTIDNTASGLPATGLDFTDNLPAGVVVAATPNASTTCTGGTLTAMAGSGIITYTGGSIAAGASCTVDVDVFSTTIGSHINTTGDLTSSSGNSGTASDTWTISCDPSHMSSISGTVTICQGSTNPEVTFTFTGGEAPYTFTYKINGSTDQMVTTTMGNSVTVSQSTATAGIFTYTLVSAVDNTGCPGIPSGSAVITVDPLPTATIAGTISVCEADVDPDVTFTGAGGTAPYTFTYKINGSADQTVTTTIGSSVTVSQSTAIPGLFTYTLVSVEDANMCSQLQTGSAIITVNPLPTASVSGTITICEGDANPDITFTGAGGTAPYTFTYTLNGGANQGVTTTMGNAAVISHSSVTPGVFTYALVSVEDANMCSQAQTGSAIVTVNPLPTATISGTISVCEADADPDITFTGASGTAPYTFVYKINGGADQMVTTTIGNSVTVAQSTATAGVFTYSLVSVEDANACSQAQAGSAVVTVNPLPTATIGGTTSVCEGSASPDITFTGAGGTPPYTFTYKINGGADQMVTTIMGNSVTVAQSTAIPGTFTYSLVSVSDANMCSQAQVGSAIITVDPLTGTPGTIIGPMFTCPGLDNVPFEVALVSNTTSYDWLFTDGSVIINGNGMNKVTLDGITIPGTLSVVATNTCGSSVAATFDIKIASPEVCVLADCSRTSMFIDDEILTIFEGTDIFKAIETIESDATILSGWFKIFRAGENIDFYPPFTVEKGATFIAEIESCFNRSSQVDQKR